jgi:hypothetical protein
MLYGNEWSCYSADCSKTAYETDKEMSSRCNMSLEVTFSHRFTNSYAIYLCPTDSNGKVCPSFGPLVAPGLYRSYNDIYLALGLIP